MTTCNGSRSWPLISNGKFSCRECGREFKRGDLQGRDDHLPAHEPVEAFLSEDAKFVRSLYTVEPFRSWDPQALAETVEQAWACLDRHGGDAKAARATISDMAYGNVSLSCRAYFQPIDKVLERMEARSAVARAA